MAWSPDYKRKSAGGKEDDCPEIRISFPTSMSGLAAALLLPPGIIAAWLLLLYRSAGIGIVGLFSLEIVVTTALMGAAVVLVTQS